jgi:nucleoside-diphosphate-sugar epimerase
LGGEAAVCDAFDSARLTALVERSAPDVIVNQLTRIPDRIDPSRIGEVMEETNRLRTEGTANLLFAARHCGVERLVSQSVAFLYEPESSGRPATEERRFIRPDDAGLASLVDAVKECERLTMVDDEIDGLILRYGFFYGPDTPYERSGSAAADIRDRKWPILGGGKGRFSFIHVTDAAEATVAAVMQGLTGVYNVVDDDPAPACTWLPAVASMLGAPKPRRVPWWIGRFAAGPYAEYLMRRQPGASNARLREALGWRPRFRTWRDGFEDLYGPSSV